ncbi:MAG: radical SAM protein [Planctomycetes bacterium]|nr:radical SAM protein [Planctomycetota bacterium]
MELPRRPVGDELLATGEMSAIRQRIRCLASRHDLTTVIACAFDHRTRILPFLGADLRMVPAGVRAIGSALADCGFLKTRIVLQQWNRHFQPSQMRLDGRIPDLFLVSSMHLHSAECDRLIRDANRIDPAHRPLIVAGGARIIYEPWQVFGDDPDSPWGADVAVTGEEYVLLHLLEVLLSIRGRNESLRAAFLRARRIGVLDDVPGLVYGLPETLDGPCEELVDTGVQRLLRDLDELPSPVLGYQLLEPPGASASLCASALPTGRVRKHCMVSSVVITAGCKFRCSYCPIPAYNQRQYRTKSGDRLADEMQQVAETYGIVNFFGTDDNFFNDPDRTLDIAAALARRMDTHRRPFCKIRWATEATIHDTLRVREHLPLIRRSGLAAVWLGVEDLTGTLVKKGQDNDRTRQAFRALRENGIYPVPMMMHYDAQPLVTWRGNQGLVNQLRILRKAGALYTQVTMLTPSPGSKCYEETYASGMVIAEVNDVAVAPWIVDGNYVVASRHPRPWLKQLNLLAGYTYFFNPLRFVGSLVRSHSSIPGSDRETRPPEEVALYSRWQRVRRRVYLKARAHLIDAGIQLFGMYALMHTYGRTAGWAWQLFRGRIRRHQRAPVSRLPMRRPDGGPAPHALPGTPISKSRQPTAGVPTGPQRRVA